MTDFQLIPAGKYLGKIIDYAIVRKNETSKPELRVQFEFEVPGQGKKKLTAYKHFTGDATKYTLQFLAKLGLKGNDPSILIENHFGSGWLDEKGTFEIEVIQETFNGKTRNKIGWVNRPGEMGVGKADATEAQGLKSSLGDLRGQMMQAKKDANVSETKDTSDPF